MSTELKNRIPPFRKLRGYAFDPSSSLDLDTAEINEITYKIPWEKDLTPGPEGEYLKVIDQDPASKQTYRPVDLNDPNILAMDGLQPGEANPQFHQQMVYAVMMTTIKNFEKALGRKISWSPKEWLSGKKIKYEFTQKLLVFPHGIREQNAYYSPERKILLFGYYNATPVNASVFLPGGIVYSCLSHDIIAHETTHALLDGMYSRYMESTNPDVAAFHEGFSDIVALFQHFSYPEIVKNQIRKVKGNLDTENLLGQMAVEFGKSTGEYKALRDFIGKVDEHGNWKKKIPTAADYSSFIECHDRGALLVAAVFDAFLAIYNTRTSDLLRIATGGSGIIPPGDIHPDLVNRLAEEASKTAGHVLTICIRALDYCPPVDLNYGDYLRALITADAELISYDRYNYRVAFINAFRKRGIFPGGLPNLSVETLCYNIRDRESDKIHFKNEVYDWLKQFKEKLAYETDREKIFNETQKFIRGWSETKNGKTEVIRGFHNLVYANALSPKTAYNFENLTGLIFSGQYKSLGVRTSRTHGKGPSIEVHSLRIHTRPGPDGNVQSQIIMTLAQRAYFKVKEDKDGKPVFDPVINDRNKGADDVVFLRGGCTLIFDLDNLVLRHVISKPLFDPCHLKEDGRRRLKLNKTRLELQYRCTSGDLSEEIGFADHKEEMAEPFAFIHQSKPYIL